MNQVRDRYPATVVGNRENREGLYCALTLTYYEQKIICFVLAVLRSIKINYRTNANGSREVGFSAAFVCLRVCCCYLRCCRIRR